MFISGLFIALIFGLVIGSFINVLELRLDRLDTVLDSRSECPNCKHILGWRDLVPVLSYISLAGQCRYCKGKISAQYPIVELATGLLFVFIYSTFGISWLSLLYILIFSILMVVVIHDLKTQMVPENFVWVALGLSIIAALLFGTFTIKNMIIGGVIGGGLLALLAYGSKEKWMGTGDVKIGFILGVLLGYPLVILGLFTAFITGAIVGLIYIKLKNKTMSDSLPFVPFLALATLLVLSYGTYLLNLYWGSSIL